MIHYIKLLSDIIIFCRFILISCEFSSENHDFSAYLNFRDFLDIINISTRHDEGAAIMFPAIIPLVLLYNKLITNTTSDSSQEIVELKFPYSFKVVLFVGMYLMVWAVTGIVRLFGWSITMDNIGSELVDNNIGIVFGSILILESINLHSYLGEYNEGT